MGSKYLGLQTDGNPICENEIELLPNIYGFTVTNTALAC